MAAAAVLWLSDDVAGARVALSTVHVEADHSARYATTALPTDSRARAYSALTARGRRTRRGCRRRCARSGQVGQLQVERARWVARSEAHDALESRCRAGAVRAHRRRRHGSHGTLSSTCSTWPVTVLRRAALHSGARDGMSCANGRSMRTTLHASTARVAVPRVRVAAPEAPRRASAWLARVLRRGEWRARADCVVPKPHGSRTAQCVHTAPPCTTAHWQRLDGEERAACRGVAALGYTPQLDAAELAARHDPRQRTLKARLVELMAARHACCATKKLT